MKTTYTFLALCILSLSSNGCILIDGADEASEDIAWGQAALFDEDDAVRGLSGPPCQLHQGLWDQPIFPVLAGFSNTSCLPGPLWPFPDASSWQTVSAQTLPESGAPQTQASYILGDEVHQAVWMNDKGFTREVPIASGAPQWGSASAWGQVANMGDLPGSGALTAADAFVTTYTNYLVQSIWRGGECWTNTSPIVGGQPQWNPNWSGPFSPSLPGSGGVRAAASFLNSDGYIHQSIWQGTKLYARRIHQASVLFGVPIDICRAQVSDWTLIDTSSGPSNTYTYSHGAFVIL